MAMSAKAMEREVEAVRSAVAELDLPDGISEPVIRPGEDQDGDPIVWVLFGVQERGKRGFEAVKGYSPFLKSVRRKLYDVVEEIRPVVSLT